MKFINYQDMQNLRRVEIGGERGGIQTEPIVILRRLEPKTLEARQFYRSEPIDLSQVTTAAELRNALCYAFAPDDHDLTTLSESAAAQLWAFLQFENQL